MQDPGIDIHAAAHAKMPPQVLVANLSGKDKRIDCVRHCFCHGETDQRQHILQICNLIAHIFQTSAVHRYTLCEEFGRIILVVEWCMSNLGSVMVGPQRDTRNLAVF